MNYTKYDNNANYKGRDGSKSILEEGGTLPRKIYRFYDWICNQILIKLSPYVSHGKNFV